MTEVIRDFYLKCGMPNVLIEQKLRKLERNEDIANELAFWIRNRKFKAADAVEVQGYTAKQLADMSEYLNGEGAFMMLIALRENPKSALTNLHKGLKIK